MKALIGAAIMLAAIQAKALTVVVSNVVVASQTEENRQNYLGRSGEIVRNRDMEGSPLTVFNGLEPGGTRLQAATPVAYDILLTTNTLENGEAFLAAVDWVNGMPGQATYLIRLFTTPDAAFQSVDLGTNTAVITKDYVSIEAAEFDGDFYANRSVFSREANFNIFGVVTITSSNAVLDCTGAEYTRLKGVRVNGDANFGAVIVMESSDQYGEVSSSYERPKLTAKNCVFHGPLLTNVTTGSIFEFDNCLFRSTAIQGETYTESVGSDVYNHLWVNNAPRFFGASNTRAGYAAILDASKIAATNLFWQGAASSVKVKAFNTEFTAHTNDWIIGADSEFWNCTGIDTSATGTIGTLMNCVDENGNIIPNKYTP